MNIDDAIAACEVFAIKGYRTASGPFFYLFGKINGGLPLCRFTPSCSQYAQEAIQEWGAYKGTVLATKRFLRCNPYCRCGYDPVPKKDAQPSTHGSGQQHHEVRQN